jgi:hypothetical protein
VLSALHDPAGAYAPNLSAQDVAEVDRDVRQSLAIATMRGVIDTAGPDIALDLMKRNVGGAEDLTADQIKQLQGEAEVAARAAEVEKDRLARRAEKETQLAQEETMSDFVAQVHSTGGSTLSTREILNSNLTAAQKEHFLEMTKSGADKPNPFVINEAFRRVHLPIGDPQKITTDTELYSLFGRGVDFPALNHLRNEIQNDPLGADMNKAQDTAATMFTRSIVGQIQPEVAAEALSRWRAEFSATIQEDIKQGRDPRNRLDPNSKDYILDPKRIESYILTPAQATAEGKRTLLAGKSAAEAEMLKPGNGSLPRISTVVELNALPSGSYFVSVATGRLSYKP